MKVLRIVSGLAVLGLFACGSGSNPAKAGGGDASGASSGAGGSEAGAAGRGAGGVGGSGAPTGRAGGSSDAQCAQAPTEAACDDCCVQAHPEGAQVFVQAASTCVCKPALCTSDCQASLCSSTPSVPVRGSACAQCLQNALSPDAGSGCETLVFAACNASTDCQALLACPTIVGCTGKP